MPQRSVYIREEDEQKWKELPNKAEFIHNALNGVEVITKFERGKEPVHSVDGGENYLPKEEFVPKPHDPLLGYPCCQKSKPCKHWHFDGETSTWTNELTGATKEVSV